MLCDWYVRNGKEGERGSLHKEHLWSWYELELSSNPSSAPYVWDFQYVV